MAKKRKKQPKKEGVKKITKMQRNLLNSTTSLNNIVIYFRKVIDSLDKNYNKLQLRLIDEKKYNDDIDEIFKKLFSTIDKYREKSFGMIEKIKELKREIRKTKKDNKLIRLFEVIQDLQNSDFITSMQNNGDFISSINSDIEKLKEYGIDINEKPAKDEQTDEVKDLSEKTDDAVEENKIEKEIESSDKLSNKEDIANEKE